MENYLVEVSIPALGCRTDARIPRDITFAQAAELLWSMAAQRPDTTETPVRMPDMKLYRAETGLCWQPQVYVAQSDLHNGDKLILF